MALHPRLERPSLEAPPGRTSNAFIAGLVLAVMGTGFALAMPIAMKTWTEAARRSEEVARVRSAAVPPVDEAGDPVQVPALEVTPSPRRVESKASERQANDPDAVSVEPADGESLDALSDADDRDGEGPVRPPEEGAKRDEDDHEQGAPDDEDDDDPDTEPTGRARDEEEEDAKAPPPDDDGDDDRSGSSGSGGGAGDHQTNSTGNDQPANENSNGDRRGNGD